MTATALDSNGQPYAGKTLRYSIVGPNATTGSTTLSPAGTGVITDPGTRAGTDTVTGTYSGGNGYASSSGTATLTVK